jgi:tetratricopeptide (TPR) repeat protein
MAGLLSEQGERGKADALYRSGIRRDVKSAFLHANYSTWLLKNGNKESGIEEMREAISLAPRQTRSFLSTLEEEQLLNPEELWKILPGRVEPYIQFAEHLAEKKELDSAITAYDKSLAFLSEEPKIDPSIFLRIYKFYSSQGLFEKALEVILKGIEYLPENAGLRRIAAALYKKLGITYRAEEEYAKSLILK